MPIAYRADDQFLTWYQSLLLGSVGQPVSMDIDSTKIENTLIYFLQWDRFLFLIRLYRVVIYMAGFGSTLLAEW